MNKDIFIESNISDIYIGDSHMQCAINDSMLINSKNFANTSESYYFNYFKLNKLLQSNPNIKKVYLGFSYHNLSKYFDESIYGEYSYMVTPRYFFILPREEQIKTISWNIKHLQSFFKEMIKSIFRNHFNRPTFLGEFKNDYNHVFAVDTSMDKRLISQFINKGEEYKPSIYNIFYLIKMIKLCKNKNVEMVLINTPLHSYYKSNIPKNFVDLQRNLVKLLGVKYINLESIKMPENFYIPDGDHVSLEGSIYTTQNLKNIKYSFE